MALNIQLYSEKEIPRFLKISNDPYKHPLARRELADLGVAFWRDENHPRPLVFKIEGIRGQYIFYSQGLFDEDNWQIDEYDDESMEIINNVDSESVVDPLIASESGRMPRKDNYAWVVFNKMRLVEAINPEMIKVQI